MIALVTEEMYSDVGFLDASVEAFMLEGLNKAKGLELRLKCKQLQDSDDASEDKKTIRQGGT